MRAGEGASRRRGPSRRAAACGLTALLFSTGSATAQAPDAESGRAVIESLHFEPLVFEQPEVTQLSVGGVDVLHLPDRTLPLITIAAYFKGGYGRFEREVYAAAMGLPAMLRYGGTTARTPSAIDEELAFYAHQLSFGSAGGSITSSLNTLTEHAEAALDLWGEMLTQPLFDAGEIESWRVRQLEGVQRRLDDPARLAYSELNRLLFGDHPVGWEMDVDDLARERLTPDAFARVHRRVLCRENLTLGVTGDVDGAGVEELLEAFVRRVPSCAEPLPDPPIPEIRRARGVFLIEKPIDQAVIAMAHPAGVRLEDEPEYYAAMIGNAILGGGGFSSRLLGRVRTEEGYAYSASSLWTTPRRHEGLVGAVTRTRPENVAPAIEAILETMTELTREPPTPDELETTVSRIVNGFVFNFDTPSSIVARSMFYLAQDLPQDWLERYWTGVQAVTTDEIRRVFADHLRPGDMTILVVGDPDRIGLEALARLGPVTTIEVR